MWDCNRVGTLTYSDEHVPEGYSLRYRDVQLFMKRLRKRIAGVSVDADGLRPVRFFCAGEYGGETYRPHYHMVFFNVRLPDEVRRGKYLYSDVVEELWKLGRVVMDDLTAESAAYVAGYAVKKQSGKARRERHELVDRRTGEVHDRAPEFVQMSRGKGIGHAWYQKYAGDLFPVDHAVVAGKPVGVPRYYWERFKAAHKEAAEEVSERRYQKMEASRLKGESTPERRAVREEYEERKAEILRPRGL